MSSGKMLQEIGQSISTDLRAFTYHKNIARNLNPRGWIAHKLSTASIEWNEFLVTQILQNISDARDWRENFDLQFPSLAQLKLNNKEKGTARFVLFAMLASAAKNGCKLPARLRWGDARLCDELLGNSLWVHYFPRIAIELMAESQSPNKKTELQPFIQRQVLRRINLNRKTLTTNVSFISRYLICYGITSYEKMTPESFSDYMIDSVIAMPSSDPAWRQVCLALEISGILPKGWCNDVEFLFKQRPVESRMAKIENQPHRSNRDNQNPNIQYKVVCSSDEKRLLGNTCYNKTIKRVFAPIIRKEVVDIGGIYINKSTSEYSPYNIIDGIWKRAQLAHIDISKIEKSTAKYRARTLQYLNAYLFSYLPQFFDKYPNCLFEYPDTPSKFLGSIFVKTNQVIDYQYNESAMKNGKEVTYPVSLLYFIDTMIRSDNENNGTDFIESNAVRDATAGLRRFFQEIIDSYHGINGYTLKSNPIPELRNVGYKAQSKTKKDLFHLGYWVVFRIFLKELAKALLIISAKRACRCLDKEKSLELDTLRIEMDKLYHLNGFEHLRDVIDNGADSLIIPTSITLGGIAFEIGTINYPFFTKSITKKIQMGKSLTMVPLANYHYLMILVVAAYAGQRSSNAAYLCADTFDADYVPLDSGEISDRLVPLRVRTDKVKPAGLDSMIAEDIMVMLQFSKTLRQLFSHEAYTKPIPYQGNEQSKHYKFRPLLQSTLKNNDYHFSIAPYIKMFEDWLKKIDMPFVSKLSYAPITTTIKDVEDAKKRGSLIEMPPYLVEYFEDPKQCPFTPIVLKTPITPHSFRAQLVTVIHATTGDKEAVRMFTGQSDGTIDYYTKLDPQTDIALTPIRKKLKIASVTESTIREEDLIEAVIQLDGTSSPFFSGSDIGLNALKESGGSGLAFNYTHICPHDNQCPEDVINVHGRMNCHECSRACITEHHKVAIAAVIRRSIDEITDASAMLKKSSSQTEQDALRAKLTKNLNIASSWLVRLRYIENNPGTFIISGAEHIEHFQPIHSDEISNKLLARLQETDGAPSLQSGYLQRVASRIAGQIQVMAIRETLPDFDKDDDQLLNYDPVRFVVQNLTILAELKNTTPELLLEQCMEMKSLDRNLLEDLKID